MIAFFYVVLFIPAVLCLLICVLFGLVSIRFCRFLFAFILCTVDSLGLFPFSVFGVHISVVLVLFVFAYFCVVFCVFSVCACLCAFVFIGVLVCCFQHMRFIALHFINSRTSWRDGGFYEERSVSKQVASTSSRVAFRARAGMCQHMRACAGMCGHVRVREHFCERF